MNWTEAMIVLTFVAAVKNAAIMRFFAQMCSPLLATANSCEHPAFMWWKKVHFYPYKAMMLRKYGLFKGYARQEIEKGACYACGCLDDDERYLVDGGCTHCGGTGIYKETYYLRVYRLGGFQFLVPTLSPRRWEGPPGEVIMTIEGRVRHPEIPFKQARQAVVILFLLFDTGAFMRLLWRDMDCLLYKRCLAYQIICDEITNQIYAWRMVQRRDECELDWDIPF